MSGLCSPPFLDFLTKATEVYSVAQELSGTAMGDFSTKIDVQELLNDFPFLVGSWTYMHSGYLQLCKLVAMKTDGWLETRYGSASNGPERKQQALLAREIAKLQAEQ